MNRVLISRDPINGSRIDRVPINRDPIKRPSPRAGLPIVRRIVHMATIKDQKSTLEMAWSQR